MTTPTPNPSPTADEERLIPLPEHAFRSAQFLTQLEAEILIRQEELDALMRARDVLRGTHTTARHTTARHTPVRTRHSAGTAHNGNQAAKNGSTLTVADMVEAILSRSSVDGNGHGNGLHVNSLVNELQSQFKTKITAKNLINTLNRWVSRRKRFRRSAPNTFALDQARAGRRG